MNFFNMENNQDTKTDEVNGVMENQENNGSAPEKELTAQLEGAAAPEKDLAAQLEEAKAALAKELEKQREEAKAALAKELEEQRAQAKAALAKELEEQRAQAKAQLEEELRKMEEESLKGIEEEVRRKEELQRMKIIHEAEDVKKKAELELKDAELARIEATQKNNTLDEREKTIDQREKTLDEREDRLGQREEKLDLKEKYLEEKTSHIDKENEVLEKRKASEEEDLQKLRDREKAALQEELDREKEKAGENLKKWQASEEKRISGELEEEKKRKLREAEENNRKVAEELQAQAEQKKAELVKAADEERDAAETIRNEWEAKKRELEAEMEALKELRTELDDEKAALDDEKEHQTRLKARLENRDSRLDEREDNLRAEAENLNKVILEEKERDIAMLQKTIGEQREQMLGMAEQMKAVDRFKARFGADADMVLGKQAELEKENQELKELLAKRPSESLQSRFDEVEKERDSYKLEMEDLRQKNTELIRQNADLQDFEAEKVRLDAENRNVRSQLATLEQCIRDYEARIKRLTTPEAQLEDREKRIQAIRQGYLTKLIGAGVPMVKTEMEWLEGIYEACSEYGIHFPRRILYAFHTALKISDWSSVTVLAGVSGTGKSELPKLYAAFGGLNFINVPVQPSWDSQESMLGFFNSIDNRFEPEPLLRFLVQCTDQEEYNKYMSIVLLDEMNLAHVEYYFADFLSKLETRRGTSKNDLPSVEVKLGAGVEPYKLKLERSIMWVGTMNQDETTKSLSDKVLDRGLIINFPRPRELRSRTEMQILESFVAKTGRPMLTKNQWGRWIERNVAMEGDQKKEMDKYKAIVEQINDILEHVGRALGHRVWQSIEYYIVNYPAVKAERDKLREAGTEGEMTQELREAMRVAFEDQLVQKIMPKLRGIETRGRAQENLDQIEGVLENNGFPHLKDDFEIACEQGYGQFIWSSAKYIEAYEAERKKAEELELEAGENAEPEN